MPQYQGLLCDLDGTLADSEPLHRDAWLSVLNNRYGCQYDEHWFEQYIGTSDRVLAKDVVRQRGLDVSEEELIGQKQDVFHDTVRRKGRAFPGIVEALEAVAKDHPLAIATNSGRADTDVVVPALGLDAYTQVVVTATDVEHMKPAPDIYLLAAKRLGLQAKHCIAIEDSAPGGQAAKAAGCYLIGLNDKVTGADEVITENRAAIQRALSMLAASKP